MTKIMYHTCLFRDSAFRNSVSFTQLVVLLLSEVRGASMATGGAAPSPKDFSALFPNAGFSLDALKTQFQSSGARDRKYRSIGWKVRLQRCFFPMFLCQALTFLILCPYSAPLCLPLRTYTRPSWGVLATASQATGLPAWESTVRHMKSKQ